MLGDTLAHYRIEAQLGAGGMGVVYRAFDTRLQRAVAIKVLSAAPSPETRTRLLYEARSTSALNHPNACTIYEIGELSGGGYIAMEYLQGRPLSELVPPGGLPVETLVRYSTQIADALEHAHARGVIHRDLKPANVMLTDDERIKVLDFGLALRVPARDEGSDSEPTGPLAPQDGAYGTLAYMAPELLRGAAATVYSDVWALGVLLYELATGGLPFHGTTAFDLSASILGEPPADFPIHVPATLRAIVLRCLAKQSTRRYRSAGEVRAALLTLRSGLVCAPPLARTAERRAGLRRSVLVLPFVNLSPDAEGDYFSDGLTDEVITDLSNVRALRVISRTSSMRLKANSRALHEIATEMGVEYVLEGTVRRSGSALRVTAQLVDAAVDSPVWAHKYRGKLGDVFTIQETLSRSIVEALQLRLSADEEQKMADRPIGDPEAYDAYLRARQEMCRFTQDGLENALEHLRRGIALAGENELLLSAMGQVHWQYVNAGLSSDLSHLDRAEEYARRILNVAPESPHAQRLLGLVAIHRGDQQEAVRRLKRAAAADPNDVDTAMWLSVIYTLVGHADAARPLVRYVLDVDPLTPLHQVLPAAVALADGHYREAAEALAGHYDVNDDNPAVRCFYGIALALSGQAEQAGSVFDALGRDMPDNPFASLGLFWRHALRGQRDEALAALKEDVKAVFRSDPQYSHYVADGYALLAETSEALDWTERAVELGLVNYPLLATHDPFLAALRGEPRFETLLQHIRPRWESFEI